MLRKLALPLSALALILVAAAGSNMSSTPAATWLGIYQEPDCDDAEAQNPGKGPCVYNAKENEAVGQFGIEACSDNVDNDSDEKTDNLDPDCGGGCEITEQDSNGDCYPEEYFWGDACTDGNDNDSDGAYDGCDYDCPAGAGGYCAEVSCGNGTCEEGEDYTNCSSDCGCPIWNPNCWGTPTCGDNTCDTGEDCSSCSSDCGVCGAVCGNGSCEAGESAFCLVDCGGGFCGDGICAAGESCPSDCGGGGYCGDGICAAGESCPSDCGGGGYCGDGDCGSGEDCTTCAGDCGNCQEVCGDGVCGSGESCESCGQDCGDCPSETCNNGTDDDGDSYIDCGDTDCASDPACGGGSELGAECFDYIDNDNDGHFDCNSDPDCLGAVGDPVGDSFDCEYVRDLYAAGLLYVFPDNGYDPIAGCNEISRFTYSRYCPEIGTRSDILTGYTYSYEFCKDGRDNDNDGPKDWEDTDCYDPRVYKEKFCDDGFDDETEPDGLIDCDDPDCSWFPGC